MGVGMPVIERTGNDVASGEPVRIVHLDIPFDDVFLLVCKVVISLLVLTIPLAVLTYMLLMSLS